MQVAVEGAVKVQGPLVLVGLAVAVMVATAGMGPMEVPTLVVAQVVALGVTDQAPLAATADRVL
jgi:hypothetical protein